jgi:hypothetical protein
MAMKYMVLIYWDQSFSEPLSVGERETTRAAYRNLAADAEASNVLIGGEELQPVDTATHIRVREGRTMIMDGPYAETREQLGGFFIFDCNNLDDVIEWAARIPRAQSGTIEIRPIQEM